MSDATTDLVNNRAVVLTRMHSAAESVGRSPDSVHLVAVSKTKPASDILELYNVGQRHFGENYFQELTDKAAQLPADIAWHFIGHLQSSKASKLIKEVPGLAVVETVDSAKLAVKLHAACESHGRERLEVYLQIDTSGEETKSGVSFEEIEPLVRSILDGCSRLQIAGVMTIGAPGDLSCFDKLAEARAHVAALLQKRPEDLQLSMGMSGDFEEAIRRGATSVRVGSTIFGARIYPAK